MAINAKYVATKTLEEYLVDKTTGEPLAAGTIEFYKDNSRLEGKAVYELTGAPPNYTFTALPNPITLSAVGTPMNANGDNVTIYYLPYESADSDDEELYYVVVKDSGGSEQFTREGWPNFGGSSAGPENAAEGTMVNEISNSQFVNVLFDSTNGLSHAYTGSATTTLNIAPDWNLELVHTGAGTITVARNAIAGNANTPTNAPYTLTITPGNNITSLKLLQRLTGNPDIWVPDTSGVQGYIAGGALLGASSSVTINYVPSSGTTQEIFSASNTTGATDYFTDTVQFVPGDNSQSGGTGYVDIELVLSVSSATVISSVQVIGLAGNESPVAYRQDTINRQEDYLFHYYNPLLQYEPIPSYLIGWDFALNPAQFLSSSVAAQAVGANKSYYAWDQTILFQTTDSGITVSRGTNGALKTLSADAAGTQLALVQYLTQAEARKLLNSKKCVHIMANASVATSANVSLWYTTDASLPDISSGTNNSIVATLDASGKPATQNGTWTELARSNLGDADFTIGTSATTEFNEYKFRGWDLEGAAATNTATFFAIVVGTASLAQNAYVEWSSISLQDGDIPTRPAPQTRSAVLLDCQRFYEKSFAPDTIPAQNVGTDTNELVTTGLAANTFVSITVKYATPKQATANVVTYNPAAANAEARNESGGADCNNTTVSFNGPVACTITTRVDAGGAPGVRIGVHWSADARLGIV